MKIDEMSDTEWQELNQIQQHEAQWRQTMIAPHTADRSRIWEEMRHAY